MPIAAHRSAIVDAVTSNDAVILVGETGSGKTTQVPQFLWEAGLLKPSHRRGGNGGRPGVEKSGGAPAAPSLQLVVTQPRRVAAITVAQRVAAEMGTQLGGDDGLVGYSVRFDDTCGPATRIKFVTDGMLLRCVPPPAEQ